MGSGPQGWPPGQPTTPADSTPATRLFPGGRTPSLRFPARATRNPQGFAVGMHAALHINPYYGKTSEAGLYRHFEEALAYGPTIVYNVAARTAQDIAPHVMENLAEHANFAGVKVRADAGCAAAAPACARAAVMPGSLTLC